MDLSVIIVSFNTRDLLRACLASIPPAATGLTWEAIVVDNASGDGSLAMVAGEFPETVLIRNPANRGFAAANNQALAISRGRYVLLLNSDAALLPGSVAALIDHCETHPRCGLVGAQLRNGDGSFQASYADFPSLTGELLLLTTLSRWLRPATFPSYPETESQAARTVDWVFGACMLARRAAIAQVGGLDEEYFMYTEETDWCYRFRQASWTVDYQPAARVLHWSGQSANRVPERKRGHLYRSKWLFMRKHYRPPAAAVFRQAVRLASATKCLVAWLRMTLSQGRRRELARQHLRSYQLVLTEL
jgi:N-acetylglucosaminyl-diphospho-decaprenol L-rhamnosyltransferase